ncbi:MAG: T9SS type A sorting domain-containing protein, partial [Calditrichaeota bacterium]|nr:T9SS type A sorting domain-containing protein [Calditrichota bacterium]
QKEDIFPDGITSVKYLQANTLSSFHLKQNFPNPFNPITTITFYLPKTQNVSLKVYDNQGKLVDSILNQKLSQGNHEYSWDANQFASGVYYYQLISDDFVNTKKMLLMK